MEKKIYYFVGVVVLVLVAVIFNGRRAGMTAGGGLSLKEANDTNKITVVSFAEVNTTTEENLAQILTVANWEHQNGAYFVGAEFVGTVSTQFGVMCPTYAAKAGVDFNAFRLEAKAGNFTRNTVKTGGFDPQYQNFLTLAGEAAPVSKAVQVSIISKNTKVFAGHQNGASFYKFNDGNYYFGAEQRLLNLALSGGIDLAETTTGYAAAKLTTGNNVFTLTANKLGDVNRNYAFSYNHNNIGIAKDVKMNIGASFWMQPEKKGLQIVTGLSKGRMNLFAQASGLWQKKFKPVLGLGLGYRL